MRLASAAGSCPGSSPSGRLLRIVRTPARASASMSARSSRPATLTPSPKGTSWGAIPLLRKRKSGGELRRPLHQVAGADPEALEPAQGDAGGLKVIHVHRRLRQHAEMPLMHRAQLVPQPSSLFGQMHVDRPAVVRRALLREIPVLDHLLDVVGDVRAEIAAAQGQLADGHFGVADIEEHHSLDIVDVVNSESFELELHY